MTVPTPPPRLLLLHDAGRRALVGVETGRSFDDQPPGCHVPVCEGVVHLLDHPRGRVVGFGVRALDDLDPHAPGAAALWRGPTFDVPALGLEGTSVGGIVLAARHRYGDRDSLAVRHFTRAVAVRGEDALAAWQDCLDVGDGRAHYALGYALADLGRPREAYAQLRRAVVVGPHAPWAWRWLGDVAAVVGETAVARDAYRRAIALAHRSPAGSAGASTAAYRGLLRLGRSGCNPSPTPSPGPTIVSGEPEHRDRGGAPGED